MIKVTGCKQWKIPTGCRKEKWNHDLLIGKSESGSDFQMIGLEKWKCNDYKLGEEGEKNAAWDECRSVSYKWVDGWDGIIRVGWSIEWL